jgi:hypothetical protein
MVWLFVAVLPWTSGSRLDEQPSNQNRYYQHAAATDAISLHLFV